MKKAGYKPLTGYGPSCDSACYEQQVMFDAIVIAKENIAQIFTPFEFGVVTVRDRGRTWRIANLILYVFQFTYITSMFSEFFAAFTSGMTGLSGFWCQEIFLIGPFHMTEYNSIM